jgi:hypothetical protein
MFTVTLDELENQISGSLVAREELSGARSGARTGVG